MWITCIVCKFNREAKKVFLEVLKPFSSEKGFKPPEALGAKRRHSRQSRGLERSVKIAERSDAKHAKKAQRGLGETRVSPRGKGLGGNPEGFPPTFFAARSRKK